MTKFILEINLDEEKNKQKAKNVLMANSMYIAINSYYDEVFRSRLKHADYGKEAETILQNVANELHLHFEEFLE